MYVVAVSGGVDSMTLLHLLANNPQLMANGQIVVGHFNHGIRPDAGKDEALVLDATEKYGLKFEVGYGDLGPSASEDIARRARYKFLFELKEKYNAVGIITAHHQDDLLETAAINILRGTGWRGLVAMQNNKKILRPLLGIQKSEIVEYAVSQRLVWREDFSNKSGEYLRNRVRLVMAENLKTAWRHNLLKRIESIEKLSYEINKLIATTLQLIEVDNKINRHKYSLLPVDVAYEVLMEWLRRCGIDDFDNKAVVRLDVFLRTAAVGKTADVGGLFRLVVDKEFGEIVYP